MTGFQNSFDTLSRLQTADGQAFYFDIHKLAGSGFDGIHRMPFSIKILLENLIRSENGDAVTREHIENLARWNTSEFENREIPFMPARILLQDFTGVPAIADIAAMRDAARLLYQDPMRVRLKIPAELVIDHSVQVDYFGSREAFDLNVEAEYRRNGERYEFLKWAHNSFENIHVVPPGTGIVHQVNLEYLARVVFSKPMGDHQLVFPDTLVGLDSHTTMINGIGVLGWGVGGIEAEAVMMGRPYYTMVPDVVGLKLTGHPPKGTTATDLVLYITQLLRRKGVVGKFIEFFGPAIKHLHLEDRATIANMAPEYGATMGFFPADDVTLEYLKFTGRSPAHIDLIERYLKTQGLFRTDETPDPRYSDVVSFEMGQVEPSLAGPSRPQDRILLSMAASTFVENTKDACEIGHNFLEEHYALDNHWEDEGGLIAKNTDTENPDCIEPEKAYGVPVHLGDGDEFKLFHGSVLIAAITSCTNTSNPYVMIQAGLLARKAVEKGLKTKPWVKTSLAPGSRVVTDYLASAGLLPYLEILGFHKVAYGCTTCIGNSGPIAPPLAEAVKEHNLVTASVLSGNRNFSGRISPITQSNFLASPPLVVAYALCGNIGFDLCKDHLGHDAKGSPVYLKDIWPADEEVYETVSAFIKPEMYSQAYQNIFEGSDRWKVFQTPKSAMFSWDPSSTYIKPPPFLDGITRDVHPVGDISRARVLALLGNSVTTDHISPAGAIPGDSPAGRYLMSIGVKPSDFNSYGSRRGNHEVMVRGTFGNIRLQNKLVPGIAGGWTRLFPENEEMPIYSAAMRYAERKIPLLVIAGSDYGTGSSRDWAAKGTLLLGVKAVIARSFERIHRSNLICMGVLPLEFKPGENDESLHLDGTEIYDIRGIENDFKPGKELLVRAFKGDGTLVEFSVISRLDNPVEVIYYHHGGILPFVLRNL